MFDEISRKDLLIHTHLITQNVQMKKISYLHWNVVTKYMNVILKETGKFSGCLYRIIFIGNCVGHNHKFKKKQKVNNIKNIK